MPSDCGNSSGVSPLAVAVRMSDNHAVLSLLWPIDLRLTVMSHGWARLAPWHWGADSGRLARGERIGARLGTLAVTQHEARSVAVACDGFAESDRPELLRRVRRWLSAEWDPAPAVAALSDTAPDEAELIARGAGRILRCSTFYEDFVKTVLTINTSWSATLRMSVALVAEPGGGGFPDPEAILDYGEARLRERAKLGFRAATVITATRRMLDDGILAADGRADEARLDRAYLTGLKGIGPYAAAHCGLLLHDFRHIPVDTVAVADLRERFGQTPEEFASSRAEWREYLALGYKLTRLRARLGQPPG
jgi:3-methyladenine DNA glycosylase/8-oxoguanine DNA glycosylase